MKNIDAWQPTKFVLNKHDELSASKDTSVIDPSSWLMADLIAEFYGKNLSVHARGKLIDLGCGKVPLYSAYKNFVDEVVCVDWQNTIHGTSFLDFDCDLNRVLPFQDNEFNTVILSDVLEHIAEPNHIWTEIARIMAPGGKVLLNVPFFYWIHERPHDFHRYTEYALSLYASKANLNVICLKPLGGSIEVFTDLLSKHLQGVPGIGNLIAMILSRGARLFGRTALGQKLCMKSSRWFPFGYFLIAQKPTLN